MPRLSSLRARLTAVVTVLFAAWVGLICAALLAYSHRGADRNADQRLKVAEAEIAGDLREEAGRSGSAGLSPHAVIAVLESEPPEDRPRLDLPLMVIAQDRIVWRSTSAVPPWPVPHDDDWRIRTVPAGASSVVVALNWGRAEEALWEQAGALLCLGLLAVAAAALGSWRVVGHTLSPIGLLSRHAQEASVEGLQVRLQAPSQDAEITELVATLNGLLERLSEAATARGRFYAAASHELRTPLQALSGHLEVALSRDRTGEEYRATLREALLQSRRLIRLAQDLLLLNRLGATDADELRELVDLAEVCRRTLGPVQSLVATRQLRLIVEEMAEVALLAPPTHVEVLLRNLVENAVFYARDGGQVRVSLHGGQEGPILTIFNECPPVVGWETASLFEPFSRLDKSRRTAPGGHGLGLAICGAVAQTNGWTITLDHKGNGVLATVVFGRGPADGEEAEGESPDRKPTPARGTAP